MKMFLIALNIILRYRQIDYVDCYSSEIVLDISGSEFMLYILPCCTLAILDVMWYSNDLLCPSRGLLQNCYPIVPPAVTCLSCSIQSIVIIYLCPRSVFVVILGKLKEYLSSFSYSWAFLGCCKKKANDNFYYYYYRQQQLQCALR